MYCTATVLWERGHGNRQLPACCVPRSRVFRDSEPVQDVLLVPGETQHVQISDHHDDLDRHHHHGHDHHHQHHDHDDDHDHHRIDTVETRHKKTLPKNV